MRQGSLRMITSVPALLCRRGPGTSLSTTQCQPMKSPTRSVFYMRSCDVILWLISVTRCPCYMQCLGHELVIILGFPPVMYPSLKWGTVPKAGAVATGEVSCYNWHSPTPYAPQHSKRVARKQSNCDCITSRFRTLHARERKRNSGYMGDVWPSVIRIIRMSKYNNDGLCFSENVNIYFRSIMVLLT